MTFAQEDAYNLFDAFAPSSDQVFEYGSVATYSLDLAALTGLMGTLSGSRESLKRLSAVELVCALDRLKGKLWVTCQRGRIVVPRGAPSIIAQLERFIVEELSDERRGSWHPKAVLCAYRSRRSAIADREWRLWVGSRNLTGSADLEAGLLLTGHWSDEPSKPPEGLPRLLRTLLKPVFRSENQRARIVSELSKHVRWRTPDGVELEELQMWLGSTSRREPTLDLGSIGAAEAVILTPFIDEGGLRVLNVALSENPRLGSRRILVTTNEQLKSSGLREQAVRSGFALKVFTPPAIDLGAEGFVQPEIVPVEDEGLDGEPAEQERGLHAKIYMFRGGGSRKSATIFVGSANVTERALTGRNSEVVARLQISSRYADSLMEFAAGMNDWEEQPPDPMLDETAKLLADLHRDRNLAVATLDAELRISNEGAASLVGRRPALQTEGAEIRAALLTRLQYSALWGLSEQEVELARDLPKSEWTDLVAFELRVPHNDLLKTSWIQRVSAPALTAAVRRDCADAAVVRYLAPDELLELTRSQLTDLPPAGTRAWTEEPSRTVPKRPGGKLHHPVTLEDLLAARMRDPAQFSSELGRQMLARIRAARQRVMQSAIPEHAALVPMYQTLERVWEAMTQGG